MNNDTAVRKLVERTVDHIVGSLQPVKGSSFAQSYRAETDRGPIFIKVGAPSAAAMFAAEAAGLQELARANAVRVPAVFGCAADEQHAVLALEWLDLRSGSAASAAVFGQRLAMQHRVRRAEFGWDRDNTIGNTPQDNTPTVDWVDFWRTRRLGFQLQLAAQHGADKVVIARGEKLCDSISQFFAGYDPQPSLLHGDLWSGNYGYDARGEPVIFDPAVYFGDRETDIAMTRLFGGFSAAFYDAYNAVWPLDSGADVRCSLYNLYHVLNHFNLFGGGYLAQARSMIEKLLAEIR